ncbi:6-phosphogluconolactonase [Blastopirellula marina DSM 3645]|uniref:6-phosphogluconolactonase n=1 Tax=Blastopirellula marina DSM 3645 TaxID=314230 RepID=A4A1R4_9BACT|nr:6-phosphogluconolactonase [Blastopirellula marina DSM 3645]
MATITDTISAEPTDTAHRLRLFNRITMALSFVSEAMPANESPRAEKTLPTGGVGIAEKCDFF